MPSPHGTYTRVARGNGRFVVGWSVCRSVFVGLYVCRQFIILVALVVRRYNKYVGNPIFRSVDFSVGPSIIQFSVG